jgi:hypothetical protein
MNLSNYEVKIVFFTISQLLWTTGFCQTGAIKGQVTSRINGIYEEMMFAQVQILNTNVIRYTDYNGRYKIDSIPVGVYEIGASYVLREYIKKKFEVVKDSVLEINFEFTCQYEKHEKDKTCPICLKSDRVVPVAYGMLIVPMKGSPNDTSYYWAGTDQIPLCHPNWYCKRDKFEF